MRLPRPSAPLAVSFLALFVALGGWAGPPSICRRTALATPSSRTSRSATSSSGRSRSAPARSSRARSAPRRWTRPRCSCGSRVRAPTARCSRLRSPGTSPVRRRCPSEYGTQPQNGTLTGSQKQVATVSLPGTRWGLPTWPSGRCKCRGRGLVQAVDVDRARCRCPSGSGTQGDFDSNLRRTQCHRPPRGRSHSFSRVLAGSPQTLGDRCTDTSDAGEPGADASPSPRRFTPSRPPATTTTDRTHYAAAHVNCSNEHKPRHDLAGTVRRGRAETVANFRKLGGDDFYDGIIFHRIIPDFMIQGGSPTGTGTGGPATRSRTSSRHKVVRGALAMANAGPNTNGSQFFIVTTEPRPGSTASTPCSAGHRRDGRGRCHRGRQTGAGDRPVEPPVIESIELESDQPAYC